MNLGTGTMDLSGYEIRDNSDDHRWQFVEGHGGSWWTFCCRSYNSGKSI